MLQPAAETVLGVPFRLNARSATDQLSTLQDKMQECIDNGARLGWLIDPTERRVSIYRPGLPIEQQNDPSTLNGDPVLPGFVFPLNVLYFF